MSFSVGNVYANVLTAAGLVCLSGLFSGLTLGLMSLDITGLQILAESGNSLDRERAITLIPVRRHGNLLLCSLLIGNTITNALLAILLADMTSGVLGLFLSTSLIVVFGEIMPQAICSRHRLSIGARTILLTRFVIAILFVVAYPISKILDLVLGKEIGIFYNREELKTLIALHVDNPNAQLVSGLTEEDSHIMSAVLDYKDRPVKNVMTTIDRVFMMDASMRLTFETMMDLYKSGYTRIPIYENHRSHIIGILYTKDLILIDPDDEVEIRAVLAFHGMHHGRVISDHTTLQEALTLFKRSYSHMMIAVTRKGDKEIATGIITLEDVIEEMLNEEIIDESDQFIDNTHRQRLTQRTDRPDVTAFLNLFNHKLRRQNALTKEETAAVCAYLKTSVSIFSEFRESVLAALVSKSEIIEMGPSDEEEFESFQFNTKRMPGSENNNFRERLKVYRRGCVSDVFSLVLQGQFQIEAGSEKFESTLGPWGFIGVLALTGESYVPDFDATAVTSCRILQISKEDYESSLKWMHVGQIVSSKLIGRSSGP